MKKNIVIALLILISASFAVFAKIKADEAEKAYLRLSETMQQAQQQSEAAAQFQERAFNAAAEAVRQEREAERLMAELKECQSK